MDGENSRQFFSWSGMRACMPRERDHFPYGFKGAQSAPCRLPPRMRDAPFGLVAGRATADEDLADDQRMTRVSAHWQTCGLGSARSEQVRA